MKRKRGGRDTAESRKPPLDDARGALSASRRAEAGGRQARATAATRRRMPVLVAASMIVLVALAAAGAWFHFAGSASTSFTRSPNQNILLITIDTLRADAIGCYGGRAATPNLDRLASMGTRFDFAHAHAVVTLPAHASILTGLYPTEHGIHDNAGFRLASKFPTLGAMLRQRGMATGAFIGSFALDSRFGLNAGFDTYDERYGKSIIAAGFTMPERRADAVVAAATEWLGRQQQPWFAWVHVFDPHAPYAPPAPFDRQYADSPYAGEVAFTDSALGPLLDAARDASGRPTLVIVTGDHGEGLGDHGELTHGLFAYESTLRIPLIIAQLDRQSLAFGPAAAPSAPVGQASAPVGQASVPVGQASVLVGQASAPVGQASAPVGQASVLASTGLVSSIAARHVDIVPTVFDALGLPKPKGLPGRTLLPDAGGTDPTPRSSYFEALSTTYNRGWAPLTGVLVNRDKLIDLPLPEMYDLGSDPKEANNLIGKAPERQRTLEARLQAYGPAGTAARQTENQASRAQLQALGYVTGSAAPKARYTEEDDPKRLVNIDRQLREAIDLYERRQPTQAMAALRQVIAERPSMEVAYSQLAMIQWEVGQPAEAVATLRASIKAGCDSLAIKTRLGTYLAESGQLKEAVPLLELAAAADTVDTDALNALGIALARAGRSSDARAAFERILAAEPANSMALENLGSIALGEGRMNDARRHFTAALAADADSTQANNGMGVVELKAGNRAAALQHFARAVRRDPANYDALYNLATELANDGQIDTARPYLEQFVRTAPPAFYARDIQQVQAVLKRLAGR
jgi:choline-sulfatase